MPRSFRAFLKEEVTWGHVAVLAGAYVATMSAVWTVLQPVDSGDSATAAALRRRGVVLAIRQGEPASDLQVRTLGNALGSLRVLRCPAVGHSSNPLCLAPLPRWALQGRPDAAQVMTVDEAEAWAQTDGDSGDDAGTGGCAGV